MKELDCNLFHHEIVKRAVKVRRLTVVFTEYGRLNPSNVLGVRCEASTLLDATKQQVQP